MSNELNALLERVRGVDAKTASALREHIEALSKPQFGLSFERHMPEQVTLHGSKISSGDKVHFIAPRGTTRVESTDTWRVKRIRAGVATLIGSEGAVVTRAVEDLARIADFRDPIYPGLVSTGTVERGGDRPFHSVINGENYHVLESLLYTYEGQVDAIYIDPPYNTGAKDWKYNNDYVDDTDTYRHSKWLSFIEKRLKIAKRLLNPANSVLIFTIDEKEVHRAGLLLGQIFPEARTQMVSSVINPSGSVRNNGFSRTDEYLFFVMIGECTIGKGSTPGVCFSTGSRPQSGEIVSWRSLLRGGTGAERRESPLKFYPILVDSSTKRIVGRGPIIPMGQSRAVYQPEPGIQAVWPIRSDGKEGRWQLSTETFDSLLSDGLIKLTSYSRNGKAGVGYLTEGLRDEINNGDVIRDGVDKYGGFNFTRLTDAVTQPRTQWNTSAHDASGHGSMLLKTLMPDRKFPFPKSLYAVEDALRFFVADKPDALVLDFFGGSGTTAHAVMRLNHQDGGRRRSIVVTNNEVSADEQKKLVKAGLRQGDADWEKWGICDYITKPRVRAAITGKTPEGDPIKGDYKFVDEFPMTDGFEENVEFFTLTYENPMLVELNKAFGKIAPLLWLRAGAEGRRIDKIVDTGWDMTDVYGVLFDVDAAGGFLASVEKAESLRVAYVVTDDESQYQAIASQIPGGITTVRLYESYLKTFQINSERV